jgi:hypothetical protein
LYSKQIPFFSPWGPRYKKNSPLIKEDDLEVKTLEEIRLLFDGIKSKGYSVDFLLMPADFYGTNINNLSPPFVREYFACLRTFAKERLDDVCTLSVRPWSAFRVEYVTEYETLRQEIEKNPNDYFSDEQFEEALKTARVFNPKNAYASAWNYCVERVVEAAIIKKLYSPIKLSLVRKEKDILDGPLKRLYVIQNKAPWLGGE